MNGVNGRDGGAEEALSPKYGGGSAYEVTVGLSNQIWSPAGKKRTCDPSTNVEGLF
jgi:hypothetical protein